jgi:ribonuclease P protein component
MAYSRFGVTISKKVDKRATKRNEIRRLFMREMARLITGLTPPRDILVIVKPQAASVALDELAKVFTQALLSYHQ